jgi:hypothetical protein
MSTTAHARFQILTVVGPYNMSNGKQPLTFQGPQCLQHPGQVTE